MNVLSLFDGISVGRVALEKANIQVDKYYSSEIDKYAIQVADNNWSNNIKLGDVTKWKEWDIDWASIDLLIGGSPCTGFSFSGKQLNFNDPQSKLFFVYADILHHLQKVNPNVKFLLENVKMKKEYQDKISEIIGVEPVEINSALLSAQSRRRLYWKNWYVPQPEDKGIMLKDIVHENTWTDADKSYCIDANYWKGGNAKQYYEKARRQQVYDKLKEYIVPFDKTLKILDKEVERGKVGYFRKDSQANRVYYIHDKAVTLTGEAGGGAAKMGQYLFADITKNYLQYDLSGKGHKSQDQRAYYLDGKHGTLPATGGETKCKVLFGCITPDRVEKRQNGQRFSEGKKFYTLTAQDQHGILIEGYIRKLTPIEAERLQTLPDNYTEGISNSQRYKCLGNSFTSDVIAHILSNIDNTDNISFF